MERRGGAAAPPRTACGRGVPARLPARVLVRHSTTLPASAAYDLTPPLDPLPPPRLPSTPGADLTSNGSAAGVAAAALTIGVPAARLLGSDRARGRLGNRVKVRERQRGGTPEGMRIPGTMHASTGAHPLGRGWAECLPLEAASAGQAAPATPCPNVPSVSALPRPPRARHPCLLPAAGHV